MVKDTINWAIGTGITLAVASKALKMIPPARRTYRRKRKKKY